MLFYGGIFMGVAFFFVGPDSILLDRISKKFGLFILFLAEFFIGVTTAFIFVPVITEIISVMNIYLP